LIPRTRTPIAPSGGPTLPADFITESEERHITLRDAQPS
jgi:hypothetical protein